MLTIPTTQESFDTILAQLEAALEQTAPIHDLAFLRVLAGQLSMMKSEFYSVIAERTKQNFVQTATGLDLQFIGAEPLINVVRKTATPCIVTADINTVVTIPDQTIFIADSNKAQYRLIVDDNYPGNGVPYGGVANCILYAVDPGTDYVIGVDETLTLMVPIIGSENSATVIVLVDPGTDEETDQDYRRRITTAMRNVEGGGNAADYREWSEEVTGVARAYPYSGCTTTHNRVIDGNMELAGTTYWTSSSGATLSKSTSTPHSGTQCLKITRGTLSNGGARQVMMSQWASYTISGYARGDGTCNPRVYCDGVTLWDGTTSTDWQAFSFTYDHITTASSLFFISAGGTSTHYVEFDDVLVVQSSDLGDVTVMIEATTDIEPDGIPTQTLLNSVKTAILKDDNNIARIPLGVDQNRIHVEAIYRTELDLEIRGLVVSDTLEDQVKDELETNITTYLLSVVPYIEGLDSADSNNSIVSDLTLSQYIMDILQPYGATADGIGISLDGGFTFVSSYTLGMGELLKLGTISYI